LVVDDEDVVRATAKLVLQRYGYEVLVAENGQAGVDLFRAYANQIDVVLLDMTMPVMSGQEAFQHMRLTRSDVRVILSSGYNEVESVRRFTSKGLAGFLQKPYTAAQLALAVKRVVESGPQS
jgi:CheY-like chemotaxis protein